jgi:type VI secretion system protein ImpL
VLNFLSDNLAIVTLLGLTAVVLLLLGVVAWAALRGAEESKKPQSSQPVRLSVDSLKQSFRRAVELIETNVVARSERYNIPWVLVINEKGGTEGLPLVQSGLQSALSSDSTMSAAAQGMTWNFFDKGVTVQLQADCLGSAEGDDPNNRTWDEFLGLCRDYRPDRPFDSVVLSVPAQLLMRDDPQALLEIVAMAKSIHRRLWLAQNRFALRFPIYLVVSDCDAIPGFARFAAGLPEAVRSSMLGWSTPYDLAAPYQSSWADAAMNAVVSSLSDACAEMSALELAGEDSSSYFLLPSQVEALRAGLKMFADELMRPSAYHEPFILRGFYLTGDCSDTQVLKNETASLSAGTAGVAAELAGAEPELPALPGGGDWGIRPAFLRDIFERKIFAESGLVRPSSVQRLRRPALNRTARWAGVGVVCVWGAGLAYSSFRLNTTVDEITAAVLRIDREGQQGDAKRMEPADAQRRAVEDLALLAQVDSGKLNSVFMPGSFPYFDSIQDRLQVRLEHGFAENALKPIRLGLNARLSELTGVAADPATGQLIQGASCTLPMGWAGQVENKSGSGVSVEELPEFAASLEYIASVELLDRVLQARARLSTGTQAPAGADLKLIVQTVLGVDVPGNVDRLAVLFRKYSRNLAGFSPEPMQAAASCSFDLALKAIQHKLFAENELLQTEQVVAERISRMVDGSSVSIETAQRIDAWKSLVDDLQLLEELMAPGKGAWMQRPGMQLGQAYDTLLQRAEATALIGPAQVAQMKQQASEAHAKFAMEWAEALKTEKGGLGVGLIWSAKDNKWVFSDERAALRSSLTTLLSQSYMTSPGRKSLPKAGPQSVLSWDRSKLDQALALADSRKKFQTELLPKFPAAVRAEIDRVVSAAFADNMTDSLAQAMVLSPRGSVTAAASETERTRLMRIQSLLTELGAKSAADDLQAAISRDALARLRDLDENFLRAEVYLPRDRDFQGWAGEKHPMLQAFAVGDSMALSSYVADQQSRLDALAKEAEGLLPLLEGSQASSLLVQRWQAIVKDISRYRSKSPNSSLLALEQFVLTASADLDRASCSDKLGTKVAPGRRPSDVFAERLQQMQTGLQRRCRELRLNEQQESWATFTEGFNRDVAGRLPFAASTFNGGAERAAADVDAIGGALRSFERVTKLMTDKTGDAKANASPSVRRTLEQMERVRAFMAPLYDTDENALPGYDVAVEFRANAANEVDGNKIIEWALTVGGQTLRNRDAPKPLRWEPGKQLVLSLRIARDSPVVPTADAQQPWMEVDDKVVSYRFPDPWSLYSFIARHRESDPAGRSDNRSQLLRFEFPVLTSGVNPKQLPVESRAKVFLRLGISPAGKRTLLTWPVVFPSKVPDWGAP